MTWFPPSCTSRRSSAAACDRYLRDIAALRAAAATCSGTRAMDGGRARVSRRAAYAMLARAHRRAMPRRSRDWLRAEGVALVHLHSSRADPRTPARDSSARSAVGAKRWWSRCTTMLFLRPDALRCGARRRPDAAVARATSRRVLRRSCAPSSPLGFIAAKARRRTFPGLDGRRWCPNGSPPAHARNAAARVPSSLAHRPRRGRRARRGRPAQGQRRAARTLPAHARRQRHRRRGDRLPRPPDSIPGWRVPGTALRPWRPTATPTCRRAAARVRRQARALSQPRATRASATRSPTSGPRACRCSPHPRRTGRARARTRRRLAAARRASTRAASPAAAPHLRAHGPRDSPGGKIRARPPRHRAHSALDDHGPLPRRVLPPLRRSTPPPGPRPTPGAAASCSRQHRRLPCSSRDSRSRLADEYAQVKAALDWRARAHARSSRGRVARVDGVSSRATSQRCRRSCSARSTSAAGSAQANVRCRSTRTRSTCCPPLVRKILLKKILDARS